MKGENYMNKLFTKIASLSVGLALAVGVGVAVGGQKASKVVRAEDVVSYTLTPASGSNNSYAGNCDITIDGVTWNLTGNSQYQPWRIGGKSLSGVDRTLYSKTAITDDVTKIEVTHGAASSITVNSLTVTVASDAEFSTVVSTLTPTFVASDTLTVSRPNGKSWAGCYYKFTYNVTVSGSSNKFVEFTEAKFYKESTGPAVNYTITYDANGGEGEMDDTTNTVAECGFTAPEGMEFKTWNTFADGSGEDYAPDDIVTEDVDLYAIWEIATEKGQINFGSASGSTNINATEITGSDSAGVTWTITTVGTTSFTPNASYSQIGSGSKPATSITFTASLAKTSKVVAFSAKFGGFNSTAGNVSLKVGNTEVGTGSLNAGSDVVVSATDDTQVGTELSVTVTNIAKGVKVYYIAYETVDGGDPEQDTLVVKLNGATLSPLTLDYSPTAAWLFYADDKDGNEINSTWTSSDEDVFTVEKNDNNVAVVTPHNGGTATLKASAEGFNDGLFILTVNVGSVESIAVTGSMDKTSYLVGESWSADGLIATGTYDTGYVAVVTSEVSWTYDPESPAVGVTSVVATASIDEVSGSSAAQTVTVTKANQIQVLYTKTSGAAVDVYGYYVGYLTHTDKNGNTFYDYIIQDGEYGIMAYGLADEPTYEESKTVLHVTGSITIYSGLYEIKNPVVAVATEVPEDKVPANPVVYAAKGGETQEYASRLTTVTGVPSVSGTFPETAGTSDITITMTLSETKTVQVFYKKASQTADADAYAAMKSAVAGSSEITVKGFTSWYNGFQVQMNGYVPAVEDYTAEEFAQDLLDQTDAVCAGWKEGDNNHDAIEAIWSDLASADKYPSLPTDQKQILADANRDEEGTVVEQAMARYDYLTGRYKLSNFINGRTPMELRPAIELDTVNNNTMIIIVAIAAVSAISLAVLLVLKKKKHN